jgi:hypothetical protein
VLSSEKSILPSQTGPLQTTTPVPQVGNTLPGNATQRIFPERLRQCTPTVT